jgi:hypothetical protein
MPVEKSNIIKNLTKKGFKKDEGRKHLKLIHYHNGKETGAYTFISRTPKLKVYPDKLLAKMVSQIGLTSKKDLLDLINCPLTEAKFIDKLKNNGVI